MIQPHELRIGIWVMWQNIPVFIANETILLRTFSKLKEGRVKPIPIDMPGLLEAIGFEMRTHKIAHNNPYRSADHTDGKLWIDDISAWVYYHHAGPCTHKDYQQGYQKVTLTSSTDDHDGTSVPIEYLHQFQTLMLSITGKEYEPAGKDLKISLL